MAIVFFAQSLNLFNMEYLSSVTAMVLAVNVITQVVKEVFLIKNKNTMLPKLLVLLSSFLVVSVQHYVTWIQDKIIFNSSIVQLVFLIFLNTMFVAALSMGNYKVMNLTKERELRKYNGIVNDNNLILKEEEEEGELY